MARISSASAILSVLSHMTVAITASSNIFLPRAVQCQQHFQALVEYRDRVVMVGIELEPGTPIAERVGACTKRLLL